MSHLHSSRSRPEPLALHQSNNSNATRQDRARLLSSLRSAPVPQAYNHQYQQQQQHPRQQQDSHQYVNMQQQPQTGYDPRSAAYAQFQNAQTAYLAELQRQILVKQNEIWINQQQIEAEAALRQMSLQQEAEREREREWNFEMERELERESQRERERAEVQARNNPLLASALARRKRQSLNVEARAPTNQHERQTTPPTTHSPSSSSSVRSTPPPPAVILSAPGEPYPDTSSASGSESGETRPSTPSSTTNSSPRIAFEAQHDQQRLAEAEELRRQHEAELLDQELKSSRRRSHLDTLSNALGGRQKRRPVSMGGSPRMPNSATTSPLIGDLTTPRPHQISFPLPHGSPRSPRPSDHRYTPRSVSDSHHLLRSPNASANPSSPSQQFEPSYVSVKPATLPGHAFATRQPKGPPTNLGSEGDEVNFGTRIRQKAIENLMGLRMSSRLRGPGEGGSVGVAF